MNEQVHQVEILLVEDDPADVRLTREALRETRFANRLHVVDDGIDAIDFLRRRHRFRNAPTPDLILLDLNLPRMSGSEVLKEIKGDDELKSIPVVILTTSDAEDDIRDTYQQQANSYVTKPVDLNEFFRVIRTINDFWLTVVRLPPRQHEGT